MAARGTTPQSITRSDGLAVALPEAVPIDTAPNGQVPDEPNEKMARAMAGEVLAQPSRAARFPAGLRHFVFEVTGARGQTVVVRASRREDVGVVRDALYWSARLRPLGIPLPEVLHADVTLACHPFPFMVLERLPGCDLGSVIGDLGHDEQRRLARRLAALQTVVADLPPGRGYGFASRLEGPFPHASWQDVVAGELARSRRRIRAAGILDENHADQLEAASERFASYFAAVRPTPFLHDITTKNVIVEGTCLSGIVDVDDLCFGDPLFLVGLIRIALLANGHSAAYADAWLEVLRPDRDQRAALDFYCAIFCLNFMGELGHRFNRARPMTVEKAYIERLEGLLQRYLA